MKLPTLSVIILSQAALWCVLGAAVHGRMILLYPLAWLVIGAGFWYHIKKNPIKGVATETTKEVWANSAAAGKTGDVKSPQTDVEPPQTLAAAE